jgi:probable HAF family extracellular repeat protein
MSAQFEEVGMSFRFLRNTLAPAVGLSLCLAVAQAQVQYRVVLFPPSLGVPLVSSHSLTDSHAVIGSTGSGILFQAFVWANGKVRILPNFGGMTNFGSQINNENHIVGSTTLPGDSNLHATMWVGKQIINLDQFGGISSAADLLNNLDQVAGIYSLDANSTRAYFLTSTGWTDLGDLGGSYTYTFGINDAGMVTGQSDISNIPDPIFGIPPFHGYVWQNGVLTDFGSVFGDDFNVGNAMNEAGQIIGSSDIYNDVLAHAILYDHGLITDLSTLPGEQVSWGLGINNVGQMVGTSAFRDPNQQDGPPVDAEQCPCSAVLWQNGKIFDLNKHVPSQYSLDWALDITDDGVILAHAYAPQQEYVLLVPTSQDVADEALPSFRPPHPGPRSLRRGRGGAIVAGR